MYQYCYHLVQSETPEAVPDAQADSDSVTQTDSDSATQTDSVTQDVVKMSYTGQLFYTRGNGANQWIVRFMAVKNLAALEAVCSNQLLYYCTILYHHSSTVLV